MKKKPVKQKTVFKKRAAKKKKHKLGPSVWKQMAPFGSYLIKISCFIIGIAMISLLFVTLYDYLLKSPYMKLEEVIVTGVEEDIKMEILESSGLDKEQSLLAINLNELKQRIENHPWVRMVNLEKNFPRTLLIQAEKEEPRAVVVMDSLYYMNKWGRLFNKVDKAGELDYPVITGLSTAEKGPGEQLDWAVNMLDILEPESGKWSIDSLSEIHVKGDGNVLLYFTSMPVVKLKGSELGDKMEDLKKLVDHLDESGKFHLVRSINLNYRDGAVVSFFNS